MSEIEDRTQRLPAQQLAERYYELRKYSYQRPWSDLKPNERALWQEVIDQVSEVLEVERLAAALTEATTENERLNLEVMRHQVGEGYEAGYEHGALAAMKSFNETDWASLANDNAGLGAQVAALTAENVRLAAAVDSANTALRELYEATADYNTYSSAGSTIEMARAKARAVGVFDNESEQT